MLGRLTQSRKYLELQHRRHIVPNVVLVGDYLKLGGRIQVLSRPTDWRYDALVAHPQVPPARVHAGRSFLEHVPAPLLQRQGERHQRQLVHGQVQQIFDAHGTVSTLQRCWCILHQANVLQVGRTADGQTDRMSDGLTEAWIGAVAVDERLAGVLHEVLHVRQFVVRVDQIVAGDLRALANSVIRSIRLRSTQFLS